MCAEQWMPNLTHHTEYVVASLDRFLWYEQVLYIF